MRYLWISSVALGWTVQWSCSVFAQVQDATAEVLIRQLEEKGVEQRRDAAYELARRRDLSDDVIAALGKSTADDDTQVRVQSLTGLARAGKKSVQVLPELLKCLSSRDDQVRYRAAAAIGAMGTAAIEPLRSYWPSATTDSKIAVAQAFAIIGPGAESAIPLLTVGLSEKGGLSRYAAEALIAISPHDEAVIFNIADQTDTTARRVGISQLAVIGSLSDRVIHKLYEAVSDSDPKIREMAIIAAAKSKLQTAEKATLVESALLDSADSVRAAAIVAMVKAALPAEQFSMRIAARMANANIDAANTTVRAIALLGPNARGSLPSLVEIANRDGIDLQLVSQSMASFGAAVVPDLLAALERQPKNEAVFSRALGLIGEPAVESLALGLSSPVELVRVAAVRALGGVRPMNKSVLQWNVQAVQDSSPRVREIAVTALIAVAKEGDLAKNTILHDAILKATKDASPEVRAAALQSLGVLKYSESQLTEMIDRGLDDESPDVRSNTLLVLGQMPKFLRTRADRFVEMISDDHIGVRKNAAMLLGKLDKKQVTDLIVTACVKGLRDSDFSVRIAATESVKALGIQEKSVLDALGGNLVDDKDLLTASLESLLGFGDKATAMLPTISRLASHENVGVRVAALNAISAIEKDPQQIVGRLMEALDDKDWEVRQSAGVALGKMGQNAKNAVPKLFGMLRSEPDKGYADSSLKEINSAPIEAIPMLIEKIESDDRREAFYAVSLLGKIGPPAAESLPNLEAKLAKLLEEMSKARPKSDKGRDEFRRKFLADAIAAIKGESAPKK